MAEHRVYRDKPKLYRINGVWQCYRYCHLGWGVGATPQQAFDEWEKLNKKMNDQIQEGLRRRSCL